MPELGRYLFLAGALPLLLLAAAHAAHTPRHLSERKGLSPANADVAESMARSRLLLTARTDMWRAWIGFNLSHSLGLALLGVVVVLAGRTPASFAENAAVFAPLAAVAAAAYLVLGLFYWFYIPCIGVALSALLFAAGWAVNVAGP